ncbi:hypothetical protein C5167_003599 [Papaver somniferum]|uniref:Uncharacterized protein n=1 Tax=Papaver somniferum TaxID=3469 RepID=A0A4Y7L564_PAPSO|nr:hypothetical protein C5167_003599 [Papaver somniferum]
MEVCSKEGHGALEGGVTEFGSVLTWIVFASFNIQGGDCWGIKRVGIHTVGVTAVFDHGSTHN